MWGEPECKAERKEEASRYSFWYSCWLPSGRESCRNAILQRYECNSVYKPVLFYWSLLHFLLVTFSLLPDLSLLSPGGSACSIFLCTFIFVCLYLSTSLSPHPYPINTSFQITKKDDALLSALPTFVWNSASARAKRKQLQSSGHSHHPHWPLQPRLYF